MKSRHFEAILEDIESKIDAILDAIASLNNRMTRVEKAIEPLPRVQSEADAMRILFGAHSRELRDHNKRIAKLEAFRTSGVN